MSGIELNSRTPVTLLTTLPPNETSSLSTNAVSESAADALKNGEQLPDAGTPIQAEHRSIQASFDYDKSLKQIIITLRREDTGEVVQQFPPEKIRSLLTQIMSSMGNSLDKLG